MRGICGAWGFVDEDGARRRIRIEPIERIVGEQDSILFADIDSLIPQIASASFRRRGMSFGLSDDYQFDSGMMLTTLIRYTNFYTYQHGQGPEDMAMNPEGWGGNYFNTFEDNANQLEAWPVLQLPTKSLYGTHQLQVGADVLYAPYPPDMDAVEALVLERAAKLRTDITGLFALGNAVLQEAQRGEQVNAGLTRELEKMTEERA